MLNRRLVSLDTFRGAVILLMVLVNNAGGPDAYAPLKHAAWDGWTLTDTVFPSFLWMVGVAITLSLGSRLEKGETRRSLLPKIFRRAAILFILGLLVYAFPHFDWAHQRILGVLQRIGICYLIASLIYLYGSIRTQIIWIVSLFFVYWTLMAFVDVPDYGPGNLSVEGNFAHYVDRLVLGAHNYARTKTWDPEGIVSTLPAIGTTLFGVMAGHILRMDMTLARRRKRLLVVGAFLIALGLIWNIKLPINKKLWTDSFATLMAGFDFVILAISIWLVDERPNGAAPGWAKALAIPGMNAIAIYLASEFLAELLNAGGWHALIYRQYFAPLASPMNASLLWALAFTGLMYLLGWIMHRRGWFLRV